MFVFLGFHVYIYNSEIVYINILYEQIYNNNYSYKFYSYYC